MVLGKLLGFFGIENDLKSYRGSYSATTVSQRILPLDSEIVRVWEGLADPRWKWILGMMAAYGLRNHEVFFIDLNYLKETGICHVLEGKTTDGKTWPYPAEWVDLFNLKDVPKLSFPGATTHADYGNKVTVYFNRHNLPFKPYDLRHAFAQRLIRMGVDSRLAAAMMRHSHALHTKTYNAWLSDDLFQSAWEASNSKPL